MLKKKIIPVISNRISTSVDPHFVGLSSVLVGSKWEDIIIWCVYILKEVCFFVKHAGVRHSVFPSCLVIFCCCFFFRSKKWSLSPRKLVSSMRKKKSEVISTKIRIVKYSKCTFCFIAILSLYLTIQIFFLLRIQSLHLAILDERKSHNFDLFFQLHVYVLQFWFYM